MSKSGETLSESPVTIVNSGGCYDCGGRCVLKIHVKDGKAIRVETDDGEEPQIRACLRGRAMRNRCILRIGCFIRKNGPVSAEKASSNVSRGMKHWIR